ncbi:MAG: fibrobacter succinogenes major paralogous domain-containing protein [Prevotella sp.]|jgi:uncharacterized protein (TIGR02145 family)|nr:fibrobacter succinogenes major paralogous domain-containing protein [Prevotella sp.]
MTLKYFLQIIICILFFTTSTQYSHAQITIGVDEKAAPGALLQLTQGTVTTKGLRMPQVVLTNKKDITVGDISGVNNSNKDDHIGLAVYNINRCLTETRDGIGIFVWNGEEWDATQTNKSTIKGKSGNVYRIASFGDAGVWMIDNLAETEYDSSESGTITASYNPTISNTAKYYYYPTDQASYTGVGATDKVFYDKYKSSGIGLLYTWTAATNGTYDAEYATAGQPAKPTITVQGICPNGWYLPSDYDWGLLEKELSLNPQKYSSVTTPTEWDDTNTSTGYWKVSTVSSWYGEQGTAMKTECNTPGSSNVTNGKANIRGFDIILVGFIRNGTPQYFGAHSFFWTSTSIKSPDKAWYRGYQSGVASSGRGSAYDRSNLHSVRCKKQGT